MKSAREQSKQRNGTQGKREENVLNFYLIFNLIEAIENFCKSAGKTSHSIQNKWRLSQKHKCAIERDWITGVRGYMSGY